MEKYVNEVIKELKEQIQLHPKLNFYIVGTSYTPNFPSIVLTNIEISDSKIKYLINSKNAKILQNYKDRKIELINKKLSEFCESTPNVKYIDRNVPLITKDGLLLCSSNVSLFHDPAHYTQLGGAFIAKYIMEQIEK